MILGLLLALALEETGPNNTCCFPDYAVDVYVHYILRASRLTYQEYFNSTTSNMLRIALDPSLGEIYRRGDTGATYRRRRPEGDCRFTTHGEYFPYSNCMKEHYIYEKSIHMHGRVFYKWKDNNNERLYSDGNCVPYSKYAGFAPYEFVSHADPDVAIVDTFDTDDCVEVASIGELFHPHFE